MANEMRNQLFELLTDCEIEYAQYLSEECDKAIKGDVTKQLFKRLEFYADRLIENGVIVPPCKVGETLYLVQIDFEGNYFMTTITDVSKITMLSILRAYEEKTVVYMSTAKEKAEQKLKEMRGEQNA